MLRGYLPFFAPKVPAGLIAQLKAEQQRLQEKIQLKPCTQPLSYIAGCDSAFIGEDIFSIFVVLHFPDFEEVEVQTHRSPTPLPYIPGYLAFREVPNVIAAFNKLKTIPQLIMVDGHGIMHPRRLGIATHLGISLNIPTIGIAKKKLFGTYSEPGPTKGSYTFVTDKDETLGVALCSKDNVKPIFVSPGHLTDVESAHRLVMQSLKNYKLPEPTRIADKYSKTLKLIGTDKE